VASREASRTDPSWGAGHTLGSDETESQSIPDPDVEPGETAIRNIIFWRTGFTIENGPLRLYSDPESAELLESINQGCVHVHIYLPVAYTVSVDADIRT
jgi:UBX domain-containing protein 1